MPHRLRPREPFLLAIGLLTLVMAVALAGGWFFIQRRQAVKQEAGASLLSISDLKVAQLRTWLEERRVDLFNLSLSPGLLPEGSSESEVMDVSQKDKARRHFLSYQAFNRLLDITVVDLSGKVMLTTVQGERSPDEIGRSTLVAALRTGQPAVGSFHRDTRLASEPVVLDMAAPLSAGHGEKTRPVGAILIRIDSAGYLFPMIQSWPTNSASGETLLVERRGGEVVFLNELRHRMGAPLSLRISMEEGDLPAARAVRGEQGIVEGKDYRGVPVLAALRPVTGTPWFLVAKMDRSEVYGALQEESALLTLFLVAIVSLALAILRAFWRFRLVARLAESEERLRLSQSIAHVGTWDLDTQTGELKWSDEASRLFGLPPSSRSATFETLLERFFPEDRERFQEAVKEAMDRPSPPFTLEHRLNPLFRPDRIILEQCEVFRDPEGKPRRLVGLTMDITDRRQAEARLAEVLDLNRTIIDASPMGILAYRASGACVLSNPAAARILDFTPSELEFHDFRQLAVWRECGFLEMAENVLERQVPREGEMHFTTSRGRETWVGCHMLPVTIGGEPHLFLMVWEDTERRRAEQALRESEERFRGFSELAPLGIAIMRLDGTCLYINRKFVELFGYTLDDVPSVDAWMNKAYPDPSYRSQMSATWANHVEQAIREGREIQPRESRITCRDGSLRVVHIFGVVAGGEIHTIFQDVTESRRIQQEREIIFQVSLDLISIATLDGRLKQVSPAWTRTLGWTEEELIGRTYFELIHQDDVELARELTAQISESESFLAFDNRYRCRDGSYRWLSWKSVVDRAQGLIYAIGRDITERKSAEAALEAAREQAETATRAKSAFLANTSHEIRTPLNAIVGLSHLLLRTGVSERQKEYLTKIQQAAHNLLRIINDILDLSKIEAGKLDIETEEFDLNRLLDSILGMLAVRAEERGLRLSSTVHSDVPLTLVGDSLRLGQVLLNLLDNAIKFTREGGVTLLVNVDSRRIHAVSLRFSVKDSGIGLSEEEMARIFQPFSQADVTTTRRFGGTGLGLAISRHLVELMGGELTVESKPGEGSTFSFTVPFRIPGVVRLPEGPSMLRKELFGLRILVVDDGPAEREILQGLLRSMHFDVSVAASGEEALAEVVQAAATGAAPYDIVLLDWRMQGMDGLETARRLRADRRIRRSPIIILLTAYGREEVLHEVESARLDGFLVKPVSGPMLLETISELYFRLRPPEGERGRPEESETSLTGLKVLVVEDNEINRIVTQETLREAGVEAEAVSGGGEALERVVRDGMVYDAILMDIQMPGMDGYETTVRLRDEGCRVPIIAISAHTQEEEGGRGLTLGMNAHVAKPIVPEELLAILARETGRGGDMPSPGPEPSVPVSGASFDAEILLRRFGGDCHLLARLCKGFLRDHASAVDGIAEALASGDSDRARRMLHTLKGVAGNITALPVAQAARDLEGAIAAGTATGPHLDSLRRRMETLVQDLERRGGAPGDVETESISTDGELPLSMDELDGCLRRNSLSARLALQRLASQLPEGGEVGEVLAELKKDMERLDFRSARSRLAHLAGLTGHRLPEEA